MLNFNNVLDDLIDPDIALRIDRICDRFEAAWKAGQPLSIEACLSGVPESDRELLLVELQHLDSAYRQQSGALPS